MKSVTESDIRGIFSREIEQLEDGVKNSKNPYHFFTLSTLVEKNEVSTNEEEDFEFNQDNTIEFENEYRSPGWDRYKKNKILKWKK